MKNVTVYSETRKKSNHSIHNRQDERKSEIENNFAAQQSSKTVYKRLYNSSINNHLIYWL